MQSWMLPIHTLLISSLAATASAMTSGGVLDIPPAAKVADQNPPAQAPAAGSTDETLIKTYFKEGLRFETADKSFTYKMGAKIFFDTALIGTNGEFDKGFKANEQDGSKFRLARISGEGTFNDKIEFKWQYDFAPGLDNEVKFKDLYLGLKDLPFGNLRIGQFKEPMGLEEITSIGYSTFLERGAPDRLLPARNIGLMWYDSCHQTHRINWALGIFRDDTKNDLGQNSRDGAYSGTARISGTPYKGDANHFVHLGGSYSMRALRGADYKVDFKGESALTSAKIAEVSVAADEVQLAGAEAAWESGPFSLQSEYVVKCELFPRCR